MYRKSRKIRSVHTTVNTRTADKFNFQVRRPRTEMYKKSPYYRGVQVWDTLTKEVQDSKNKEVFKSRTKRVFGTYMKGQKEAYLNSREYRNRVRNRQRQRNAALQQ